MSNADIVFKRGSTFSYLLNMPADLPDAFFANWTPSAQLRKSRSNQSNGLVADLSAFWGNTADFSSVAVRHTLTEKWPVGLMDLDILFTSADGEKMYSNTILVEIVANVTRQQ